MTTENDDHFEHHDAQARLIADAVAELWCKVGARGLAPEAFIQGAINGAALVVIGHGGTAAEFADILDDLACGFRNLNKPNLRVVS